MSTLLSTLLLSLCVSAPIKAPLAVPVAGSRVPPDENLCVQCHGEKDLWDEKNRHLYVSAESLAHDVHFQKGVNCHDCHGGNHKAQEINPAHAKEDGFRKPSLDVWNACARCHAKEESGLRAGVHGEAGEKAGSDRRLPLDCRACHGPKAHGMVSVRDRQSPVFLDGQVRLCGNCHEKDLDAFSENVHGRALQRSGLSVTAVCADCHGAHGVYRASDSRSTLNAANVAATCGKCHRLIEERLQKSVHRREAVPGGKTKSGTVSPEATRKPGCADCHPGHESHRPDSARFRLGVPDRCGDCHADLFSRYAMSTHGALTELGYGPAATCSDCHGAHDVLPASDPASKLSAANRLETCRKCHPEATPNYRDFDPHADHRNPDRDPVLYWVYVVLMTFLISTFGCFGLHSVLWFVRSLIHVVQHGRPKPLAPGDVAYVRFGPFHRMAHIIMVLSFLGLALTGLPLKYNHYEWAKLLARGLGGFAFTAYWHRMFGVVNIGCLVVYLFRMVGRLSVRPASGTSRLGLVFGPDSPVPNLRDLKDLLRAIRWFLGLGPKPTFERWTYWEKFDFWGACADIVIIGSTGLVLWFPDFFCSFFSGRLLNIAKVIHSTQALLATGFVFAIHFFATHLRPEKFPMDMAILTGLVSEEDLHEERPEYLERMRREGKLDQLRGTPPPRDILSFIGLGGFVALAIGLGLLAGILFGVLAG